MDGRHAQDIRQALATVNQVLDLAMYWANNLNALNGHQHAVAEIEPDSILIETRWNDGEIDKAYSFKPEHLVNAEEFAARWAELEAQRQVAEKQRRLENERKVQEQLDGIKKK